VLKELKYILFAMETINRPCLISSDYAEKEGRTAKKKKGRDYPVEAEPFCRTEGQRRQIKMVSSGGGSSQGEG